MVKPSTSCHHVAVRAQSVTVKSMCENPIMCGTALPPWHELVATPDCPERAFPVAKSRTWQPVSLLRDTDARTGCVKANRPHCDREIWPRCDMPLGFLGVCREVMPAGSQ